MMIRLLHSYLIIIYLQCIYCFHSNYIFGYRKFSPALQKLSPTRIYSIQQQSNEEFLEYIKYSRAVNTTYITNEVDYRLNSLNFNGLCDCLLILTENNNGAEKNYRVQNIIEETLESLIRATQQNSISSSSITLYCISTQSIVHLLNSLVRSHYSWDKIAIPKREILTYHITRILYAPETFITQAADIIWCFGRLKTKLSTLPIDANEAIMKYFECYSASEASRACSKLVYGYSLLSISWKQLSELSQENIKSVGISATNTMNEQEIVNFIYACAKLGAHWSRFSENQQEILFENLLRVVPIMNDQAISNVLWALGKLGCRWRLIPPTLENALFNRVAEISPLGPTTLSSIIFGASKLGLQEVDLPHIFRNSIYASTDIYKNPSEQSASLFVYGLGCMGFTFKQFSIYQREAIFNAILMNLPLITTQGLSNVFYGLAKMGEFPIETKEAMVLWHGLIKSAESLLPQMNVQGVSVTIWALGQLYQPNQHNIILDDDIVESTTGIPESLILNIYKSLDKVTSEMTEQGVANTMLGLAKLSIPWKDIPSNTKQILLNQIYALESTMNQQGICNLLWSFGTMKFYWETMPLELQNYVNRVILSSTLPYNMQSLATIFYSFSKLHCKYSDIDTNVKSLLEANCIRQAKLKHKPNDGGAGAVGVFIYTLSKMNVKWADISSKFRASILQFLVQDSFKFSEKELGNVIWSLGQMGVDFTNMPSAFREALLKPIVKKHAELRVQALVGILQGLEKGGMSWGSLHAELKASLVRTSFRLIRSQKDTNFAIILIFALGRLSAPWNRLPSSLADELLYVTLSLHAEDLSTQKISNLFNGLACMSLTYASLENNYKVALIDLLMVKLSDFAPSEFSSTLWALARMGFTSGAGLRHELTDIINQRLRSVIPVISPGELAWSLWALGKMELQFKDMPFDLQVVILAALRNKMFTMTSRERGVSFWAMARLSIPINELSMEDRNAIIISIEELALHSLAKRRVISGETKSVQKGNDINAL